MTDPAKPTVAVALTYEFGRPDLPRIVASGRGPIAERILALAEENGVPVREDADLAALLASVELDSEIPAEAMIAVAEVMAQIFLLNRQAQAAAAARR